MSVIVANLLRVLVGVKRHQVVVEVVRTVEGASFSYDDCGRGQAAALAAVPFPRGPKMGGGGRISCIPGLTLV